MKSSNVSHPQATDKDTGDNGHVQFFIPSDVTSGVASLPFVVLPGGKIRTTAMLDKDLQTVYRFQVRAKDRGRPAMSATATVTVNVIDSNEHEVRHCHCYVICQAALTVRNITMSGLN